MNALVDAVAAARLATRNAETRVKLAEMAAGCIADNEHCRATGKTFRALLSGLYKASAGCKVLIQVSTHRQANDMMRRAVEIAGDNAWSSSMTVMRFMEGDGILIIRVVGTELRGWDINHIISDESL